MKDFKPTDEQARVIQTDGGCALVIAPPGSGKTEVLTRRVERLLRATPGENSRVLALTFSTKAGEVIRDRLERLLGDEARRAISQTFHGFATDVLHHHGSVNNRTIYDQAADRLTALREAICDEHVPTGPLDARGLQSILDQIGKWKRDLVPPDLAPEEHRVERLAYAAYERRLAQLNAADFDDLLYDVWKLLIEQPRVARHYRRMYRYILVDEAQDTNKVQYEILRALCGDEHRNVMLFADDFQAMYGFAGASTAYLKAFFADFGPDCQKLALSKNFRCAQAIVRVANELGAHLANCTSGERMDADGRARGSVLLHELGTPQEEAGFVLASLERLLAAGLPAGTLHAEEASQIVPESICILGRNRFVLDAIVRQLDDARREFAFAAGPRELFDSRAVQLFVQLCKVLRNPRDAISRQRALKLASPTGSRVGDEASAVGLLQGLAAGEESDVARLAAALLSVPIPVSEVQTLVEAVDPVMKAWTEEGEEPSDRLSGDWATLRERWRRLRSRSGHATPGLDTFLNDLALAGRSALDAKGIRVLTVHAAKGLEFPVVFLVGMNEGSFPDFRATTEAEIDDERRNAYVAVTRASRWLCVTRPKERTNQWGRTFVQKASRFLGEMGLAST